MNNAAKCLCATIALAIPAAFAAGMKVASSDAQLFDAYDKQRIAMLQRTCGSSGHLYQDPRTHDYACAYVNRDGSVIFRDVSDTPFLSATR